MGNGKKAGPDAVELAGRMGVASGELASAMHDLGLLGENLHGALDHVEAMLKCATFDPVREDVRAVRSALAYLNSIRSWVEGHVRRAGRELDWESGDEEV